MKGDQIDREGWSVYLKYTACRKALSYTASPSYKSIKNILAAGQEKIEPELQTSDSASTQNKHAITRGADYYRR